VLSVIDVTVPRAFSEDKTEVIFVNRISDIIHSLIRFEFTHFQRKSNKS